MFPFTLYIGLRYTRAKRRNHFISFMTGTSVLGIALGVTILITVLSVMNGFDQVIRDRIFSMAHHITLTDTRTIDTQTWESLRKNLLRSYKEIIGVAPFVSGQGLLLHQQQQRPIVLYGILPQLEQTVSQIPYKLKQGPFRVQAHRYQIILGEQLATDLNITVGEKVNLLVPNTGETNISLIPKLKSFTVAGIFQTERGFGFDSYIAYTHMKDAQILYQLHQNITGLRLKTRNSYAAPQIASRLAQTDAAHYKVSNWTEEYGSLMYALALEKKMMFFVLLLLIAISAFNLLSSLMMIVTDKRADIAILRSLGATPRIIMTIFLIQGSFIGLVGAMLGLASGVLLTQKVSIIVSYIEQLFQLQIFQTDAYFFVDHLPSKIESKDLIKIISATLCMSIVATLYPAWRASQTLPAQALRYE